MGGMKRKVRRGGKPMSVLVLAGGQGRRMEADKASLDVGGRTLLEHGLAQVEPLFDEVLVSLSPGQAAPRLPAGSRARFVRDGAPGLGPIGGLLAGLKAARNDACAVVACDIPDIDAPLLRALARAAAAADIAVPAGPSGLREPLFAVYARSVVPAVEGLLARGELSLLPLYDLCRTAVVRFDDPRRVRNLNTRADYEDYLRTPDPRRERRARAQSPGRRTRP